jgi:hypothetical protein
VRVMGADLMSKIRSKQDIYYVLSVENQLHLPAFDDCSLDFIREILSGRKKLFKLREINPAVVPKFTEFNCDILYKQAMEDSTARLYLPDATSLKRRPVNRKFLFNIVSIL